MRSQLSGSGASSTRGAHATEHAGARRARMAALPLWPRLALPRAAGGPSDAEVQSSARRHPFWPTVRLRRDSRCRSAPRRSDGGLPQPERPLQRFSPFMPWLLAAPGGACGESGCSTSPATRLLSIQCALLGADEVVGSDARAELVRAGEPHQAAAASSVELPCCSPSGTWTRPARRHLRRRTEPRPPLPPAKPLDALELTRRMAREYIVLDTVVQADRRPHSPARWESPRIGSLVRAGARHVPAQACGRDYAEESGSPTIARSRCAAPTCQSSTCATTREPAVRVPRSTERGLMVERELKSHDIRVPS